MAGPPPHVQAQGELSVRHHGFGLEKYGHIGLTQAVLLLPAAKAAAALTAGISAATMLLLLLLLLLLQ